jgi:hypothetical protein
MPPAHDPELEQFKRSVDLAAYARSAGYSHRPNEGARGLTVLAHPNRDCVVVGQIPDGRWVYASVPDYAPRAAGEPAEQALARLRQCIDRTTDRGSIVEFVQRRDAGALGVEASLAAVRERLRAFAENERARELADRGRVAASGPDRATAALELHRRRYDWAPPVAGGPRETDLDQRLRRWREAQTSIERRQHAATEVLPPAPMRAAEGLGSRTAPADRARTVSPPNKSELARRRYDWTEAPAGRAEVARGPRGRSGGPER